MIKLVIDRERWARGGMDAQLLSRKDGKMCCLGFACLAAGISAAEIKGTGSPEDLDYRLEEVGIFCREILEDDYGLRNKSSTDLAIEVNDDKKIEDPEREEKLKPILAKLGFDVEFVDCCAGSLDTGSEGA